MNNGTRNAGGLSGRKIITIIGVLCVVALIAEVALLAGIFRKKGGTTKKPSVTNTPKVTETVSEPEPTEEPWIEDDIPEGYVRIYKTLKSTEYDEQGVSAEKTYRYDEKGNEIFSELRFRSGSCERSESTYDEYRRVVRLVDTRSSDVDSYARVIQYWYDEHGNFSDIIDDNVPSHYVYQYDDRDRMIRKEYYDSILVDTEKNEEGGTNYRYASYLGSVETWEYRGDDLIENYWEDVQNNMNTRYVYTYDHVTGEYTKMEYWHEAPDRLLYFNSAGDVYKISMFDDAGKEYTHTVTEYDEDGRSIRQIEYMMDGSLYNEKTWEYDGYGRVIRIIDGEGNSGMVENKQYDDDGNMIYEEVFLYGELSSKTVNEYDEYGNCIKETLYYYYQGNEEIYVTEREFVAFDVPYELLSEDELREYEKLEARIPKK